ncbi:ArnT family glycosyltransferase [Lentilitoribacter sp. EG35]|uniref:ArnT family glycosyltransferase n=1 Tax=Lentilitoribacter sp. EG35 TaxID=3234192 RepID=UPI00345FC883
MSDSATNYDQNSKRQGTYLALGISLILMMLYMILMPATELWDRDEPLYARTAIEMLLSGDWFLPTYNGNLFAHKPPMTYWLMATSFWMFGENEFAARFASAPTMAGTAFFTYLIARRMFDHTIGIWSMIMFGTAFLTIYLGSIAQHDAPMMFFIILAIYAYTKFLYEPQSLWPMLVLFTLGMVATLYIKGPVGPAVICTTLFFSWVFTPSDQRPKFMAMVVFAGGFILACILFAIWLIPANTATDGALWQMGVGKHIIQRFQEPLENYGGTASLGYYWMLPAYIPVILITLMPWTIHLPAGLMALFSGKLGTRRERALLWGWIAPTFVMFTLAGSKLPHYIFPIFPALAMICAAIMIKQVRDAETQSYSKFGAYLYLMLSPAIAIALIAVPFFRSDIIPFWIGIPAGLIIGTIVHFVFHRQRVGNVIGASRLLTITTPFVVIFAYWFMISPAEPLIKISKSIGEIINKADVPKERVFMDGFLEPSMVFYINSPLGSPVKSMPDDEDAFFAEMKDPRPMVLVVTKELFPEYEVYEGDREFEIIGEVQAINTNDHLKDQTVVVAVRK